MDCAVRISASKRKAPQEPERKARRRDIRVTRRRAEILDAAKKVFLERDFNTVTIEAIADAGAFSRATVYLYFKNKQEMYVEVLLRDLDVLISGLLDAVNEADTMRNNLFRMSVSYMNFFKMHPEYFRKLSFFFFPGREEFLPKAVLKTIDRKLETGVLGIERCISLGIERGEARQIDARSATLALWGQWMGSAYAAITGHTNRFERTIEQTFADGIDIFVDGLSPRSGN